MFGYLTADRGKLTPEEDAHYHAAYCGLCRSLRERYGLLAGFTVNFDMCFLVLLLQSLYESSEEQGSSVCPAHPIREQSWWKCKFTDYAADMNLLLSVNKLRDDWNDDGNPAALAAASAFSHAYRSAAEHYPRQAAAIENSMSSLRMLEEKRCEDPDATAETFAQMMAEAFVYQDDRWADTLRRFGAALGRFLYLLDACMDLDQDTLRNRFNPFRRYYGLPDNEQRFRDILTMQLGECLFYFDRLPLVLDAPVLKNILCCGLWTAFDNKFGMNRDGDNGIESV
ncbi:MAG: hypothetical protein IJQ02_15450 [Oscillospiraceae bacterium]|nr:hypothetical protein [Oscillospiraceae bacterium]